MVRKKILVVDDSPTSILWQKMVLKQGEYDVVTACDGEAGVAAAAAECPDLILMDVVMPKMNGFEACRAIRERPETQHVPIIMVTTRSGMSSREEGYESGCNDYITKPIDQVELLTKVRSCLDAGRTAVSLRLPLGISAS